MEAKDRNTIGSQKYRKQGPWSLSRKRVGRVYMGSQDLA